MNLQIRHVASPRDRAVPGRQSWKVTAHAAVHGCHTGVCFLEHRINRDLTVHIRKLHNGHVNEQSNLSVSGHSDDWLGGHIPRVLHGDISAGTAAGRLDVLGCYICLIPEGLAAEVDSEGSMRIAAEDLLKRNLVDDPGIIKAAVAVGEGDCTRAAQPPGDLGNPIRIGCGSVASI